MSYQAHWVDRYMVGIHQWWAQVWSATQDSKDLNNPYLKMTCVCVWLKNTWQTLQLFAITTMVNFKRLSLKALSAFNKNIYRYEGGGVNFFYRNVFQNLGIITSMHCCICCTLSPSLSLSHPLTHTHTLTQGKSGRYELIWFIAVEKVGF